MTWEEEYAAPEKYGFGQSDARSDIYALGIILNRLITGQYPKYQLSNGHFHVLENFGRCVLHLLNIFFAFIVVLPLRSQKLEKRYP